MLLLRLMEPLEVHILNQRSWLLTLLQNKNQIAV